MKRQLVALARRIVAKTFRRDLVFLPLSPANGTATGSWPAKLLKVRYDYRASPDGVVSYRMLTAGTDLAYQLYTLTYGDDLRACKGEQVLSCSLPSVQPGDVLRVGLAKPSVSLNDQPVGFSTGPAKPARKYVAELRSFDGPTRFTRLCCHYLPYENKPIGEDYYFGDDYVNYPEQQAKVLQQLVNLVRQYSPGGRVLEIGCALGLYCKALLDAGFDPYGVDVSSFAAAEAGKRVGADRVRQCNVDQEEIPFPGQFDVLLLWDVLEHSTDPARMIAKVSERAAAGAWLFLHTSNAGSLTHRIMASDWEGYSDYSHYGVDRVSADSLRSWLKESGWQVEDWQCSSIWVEGVDPVMLRLQQVFHGYQELAALLAERDLGDLINVVARKN
jgi:2-polyprenyl-3-methyl-5-hydroxy-6-metoxy-1,4-benzoquinol methylase